MPAPYSSTLWDHFTSPRNAGEMKHADAVGKASINGRAPHFTVYLKATDRKVTRATFQTFGCGYSIAACSALTELVTGKTISECRGITADHVVTALDGMPEEKRFCADLAIAALRDALEKLKNT
jgi:nitrogen fixation NifU-like protein